MSEPLPSHHVRREMSVTLRDRVTGVVATQTGNWSEYDWTEGNWSCDCNRVDIFGGPEEGEGTDPYLCLGAVRYVLVAIDPMPEGYAIEDFNRDYPPA